MNLEAFSQILSWMWNGSWWKNWFFISEYLRKMKIGVIYSITKKRQPMQFVGYHLIYKLIRRKGLWLLISSHHNKNTKYAENISVQTEFFHLLTHRKYFLVDQKWISILWKNFRSSVTYSILKYKMSLRTKLEPNRIEPI
jgi:hypothetical protein